MRTAGGRTGARARAALALAALAFGLSGCGAAYYGAIGLILMLQKKSTTIRTTFPDAALASLEIPRMATLTIGTTDEKDDAGVTGKPVLEVTFPDGYGESRSDRGAGGTTTASDKLNVSVNGDTVQSIALDVATVGTDVAAQIQAKVRALSPIKTTGDDAVPVDAYKQFTCTFDPVVEEYRLRSGVPGKRSSVTINGDVAAATSGSLGGGGGGGTTGSAEAATGLKLRLGTKANGVERTGAENGSAVVFNHGDDVLQKGTKIQIFLSKTKIFDAKKAILVREFATTVTVEVAKARRFTSTNQKPPKTVLASSIPPGQYFVIFKIDADAQEVTTTDNVRTVPYPVEVALPFGGIPSGTGAAPKSAALDFAPVSLIAPIAVVTSARTTMTVEVANYGAAVAAPVPIGVDLVLTSDASFNPATTVTDPAGAVAGFFVNPVDFSRRGQLSIAPTGAPGDPVVNVSGDTVAVALNPSLATVASLANAVAGNAAAAAVLTIDKDGKGAATDTLATLFTAAGTTSTFTLTAGGRLLKRSSVVFLPTPVQQTVQVFAFEVAVPDEKTFAALPRKFFMFVRIVPTIPGADPENDRNDTRTARNYTKIYKASTAKFDNGSLLPTAADTDFARLDAVTQRPVNTGSITQGQQRVFRFETPKTGATFDEAQLLMIVQTGTFDPHLELLDSTGRYLASSDDSALGSSPLVYTPVLVNQSQNVFYAVVSSALFDDSDISGGGTTFDLTISVNSRQPGDPSLVKAISKEDFFSATNTAVAIAPKLGIVEGTKLIQFDLLQVKAEILFVLSGRARVRFKSFPAFTVGVTPVITRFNEGEVPAPVQFQAELDPTTLQIVYRPSSGTIDTSHVLKTGVYTITFNSSNGPDPTKAFLLEVDTEYVPESVK